VVVKNRIAGVNAARDALVARNAMKLLPVTLPFDMGVEAAGEVAAVGAGVVALREGDAVMAVAGGGGYREYQTVAAERVTRVKAPGPEVVALLPSGYSASIALSECGQMASGETVLVTAAAGGAGHIAVQLAKLAGNHVIGTCGGEAKAELLRRLGCDRVIDHRREAVAEVLAREYPRGVDLVLEGVGGALFETCVDHLAPRGRLVVLGFMSEGRAALPPFAQPHFYHRIFWNSASVRACIIPGHYAAHIPEHRRRMLELWEAGRLRPCVDPTPFVGLESAVAAIEHQLAGRNVGKVVLRIANEEGS
jgi:NADPH-dependent curcumin reductase CurA